MTKDLPFLLLRRPKSDCGLMKLLPLTKINDMLDPILRAVEDIREGKLILL